MIAFSIDTSRKGDQLTLGLLLLNHRLPEKENALTTPTYYYVKALRLSPGMKKKTSVEAHINYVRPSPTRSLVHVDRYNIGELPSNDDGVAMR